MLLTSGRMTSSRCCFSNPNSDKTKFLDFPDFCLLSPAASHTCHIAAAKADESAAKSSPEKHCRVAVWLSQTCAAYSQSPAKLEELLLNVIALLAPPGSTLSLAANDRNRQNGTTHVVINAKPNMYSRLCHESRQKCKPHRTLLRIKKPA